MNGAFGYRSEQRKRSENQDSFGAFLFDGFSLVIVCDGMGGHVGGAQASSLAVRTVHDSIANLAAGGDFGEALRVALERANQAIYEAARKNHRLMGMGTTAVAAIIADDGFVYIAHVGDSRAYLINEGQAVQVTRDHTMVNLFVDAELLTPEDAATHPEAHVLSRSLGVERQVEVEVSEPIELADSDVVLLCSDGVHGVVTDWELGSIDWGIPRPAIDHIVDIVEAREGDDNATVVAVLIGGSDSMGPSEVPDPKAVEATGDFGGPVLPNQTIIPEEDDFEPLSDPDSTRTAPSAPPREELPIVDETPSYLVEEEPSQDFPGRQRSDEHVIGIAEEPPSRKAPTPPPNLRKKAKEEAPKARRSRSQILLPLAAVGVLAVASLGAIAWLTGPSDDDETSDIVIDGTPKPPPPSPQPTEPMPVEPESLAFFAAAVPDPPRRLPHRPLIYTQPPPKGRIQFQAVTAAREDKCSRSLDLVKEAMGMSPDHAKLYGQAWFCFQKTHAKPLGRAEAESFDDFAELETHFRGWPQPGEPEIEWTAEDKRMPLWYRPARDGIEYRLEAWAKSNEDDLMTEVMLDLKGEPTVADDLAADLYIEAQAAVALSKAESTPDVEEAWARRVFVLTSALNGRVGRLLRTHRPELVPQLETMLEEATTRQEEAPPIPGLIAMAVKVGNGEQAPPTRPVNSGRPVDPIGDEPDLGSDGGRSGKTKIYK